ncbi:hypothetical protein LXL04_006781 [Taraxacum kok-saghyz]
MGSRGREGEQWSRVTYRKGTRNQNSGESYRRSSHVSSVQHSFFITNFPKSIIPNDIWRVCSRMGHVVGVYISPNLSKMGKRFGFVRFEEVKNEQGILDQLNETWFGFYKLFASTPRFSKGQPVQKNAMQVRRTVHAPTVKSTVERRTDLGNSYANVLRGGSVPKQQPPMQTHQQPPQPTEQVEEILDLQSGDFAITDNSRACFGKARDFPTLPNLRLLCMDEGFVDVDMSSQQKGCVLTFCKTRQLITGSRKKKLWNRNFVSGERIVWLDIEGLPLRAWSKGAFRKSIAKWGTVMHLDDDLGEDDNHNRVCMLTSVQHIISESLKVRVDGKTFVVRVKEASGWTPSFAKGDVQPDGFDQEDDKLFPEEEQDRCNEGDGAEFEKSEDPFRIYKTMEQMKENEIKDGHKTGFHSWPAFGDQTEQQPQNNAVGGAIPSAMPAPDVVKESPAAAGSPWMTKSATSATMQQQDQGEVSWRGNSAAHAPTPALRSQNSFGFSGGFGRVQGVTESSCSMSYAPGFTGLKGGVGSCNDISQGSINVGSRVEECRKTLEMGMHVGLDMSQCGARVSELIGGKRDKSGAGNGDKRQWVRRLCNKHTVNFLGIQETKTVDVDDFTVRSIWGNPSFMYECSPAIGNSGGIWIIWNPIVILKHRVIIHQSFIVLEATWVPSGKTINFITVYAPQDGVAKRQL